jgi:hypothetical protein
VKLLAVLANQCPGGLVKFIHHSQVVANDRPAVCVGGGQGDRFAGQPVLRRDCVGDAQRCFAIDADQVECDEHMPAARGVFEYERLGPEVGQGALGRPVPAGVARHPHQLRWRDAAASHTGPPACGVVCGIVGEAPAVPDDGDADDRQQAEETPLREALAAEKRPPTAANSRTVVGRGRCSQGRVGGRDFHSQSLPNPDGCFCQEYGGVATAIPHMPFGSLIEVRFGAG